MRNPQLNRNGGLQHLLTIEGLGAGMLRHIQELLDRPGLHRRKLCPYRIIAPLGLVHAMGKFNRLKPDTVITQPVDGQTFDQIVQNCVRQFHHRVRKSILHCKPKDFRHPVQLKVCAFF